MKRSLLDIIKSDTFALWVAILSVLVQSFHSFTAFYNASSLYGTAWGIAQGILFAVVIDLAILFYTVRNRTGIAIGAAFFMVVINAYYYYQHLGVSFAFVFGVFLSLIIPMSVYFYSEEIGKEKEREQKPSKLRPTVLTSDVVANIKKSYDAAIKTTGEVKTGNGAIDVIRVDEEEFRRFEKQNQAAINDDHPADKSLLDVHSDEAKIAKGYSPQSTARPFTE